MLIVYDRKAFLNIYSHVVAEDAEAAEDGEFKDGVLFGGSGDGHFFRDDFAGGFADGNAVGVRSTHHDALHNGLAADEGFLARLQDGEHLDVGKEAEELNDRWRQVH